MVQIYHCPKCGAKVDKLALHSLWKKKFRKVRREHDAVLNYALASDRDDLKWFFVFQQFNCHCGNEMITVHRTRFELNSDLPLLPKDLHLVHIEGAIFDPLDGLYLGKTIRGILAAFLGRWNRIADLVVICTPFISSRYTSGEWEWLVKNVSFLKIKVITRPQSYGLLKRLPIFKAKTAEEMLRLLIRSEEENFFEAVEKEILRPITIEDSTFRYRKFHAKFFAGILTDRVETLHSSFNLFKYEEKQLENLSLKIYPRKFFFAHFIHPFRITELDVPPDKVLEMTDRVGCVVCCEKNGEFSSKYDSYEMRSWQVVQNFFNTKSM